MLTDVVRRTVVDDAAGALLATLAADLEACSAEVRELIDGLRPAALGRGLEPALADLVERFADGSRSRSARTAWTPSCRRRSRWSPTGWSPRR